ncbi:hypothetical protein HK099_007508, partial [Clydaea vesicula]
MKKGYKKEKKKLVEKKEESFEDLLEEAINLEEKGDRFGAGEKSRRFYERSCELYSILDTMKNKNTEVLYNWGRLLQILSEFQNPSYSEEEKNHLISESIAKFRTVYEIDQYDHNNLFNLAQALRVKAELSTGAVSNPIPKNELSPNAKNSDESTPLYEEAYSILLNVFNLQFNEYQKLQNSQPNEDSVMMEQDGNVAEEEYVDENEKNVTLETLAETLLVQIQILYTHAGNLAKRSPSEAEKLYQTAFSKLEEAKGIFNQAINVPIAEEKNNYNNIFPELEHTWANVFWSRGETILEIIEKDKINSVNVSAEELNSNYNELLFSLENSLSKLELVLTHEPKLVEAICDKADVLITLGDAKQSLSNSALVSAEISEQLKKECRLHYAASTKLFSEAHQLEKSNRTILLKLGDIHLTRMQFYIHDKKILKTLSNGACIYYRLVLNLLHSEEKDLKILLGFRILKCLSYGGEEKLEEFLTVLSKFQFFLGELGINGKNFIYDENEMEFNLDFCDDVKGLPEYKK